MKFQAYVLLLCESTELWGSAMEGTARTFRQTTEGLREQGAAGHPAPLGTVAQESSLTQQRTQIFTLQSTGG